MRQIIVISGHTCNGKSSLARLLEERFKFKRFKTSEHISRIAKERDLETKRQDLKDWGIN